MGEEELEIDIYLESRKVAQERDIGNMENDAVEE